MSKESLDSVFTEQNALITHTPTQLCVYRYIVVYWYQNLTRG
jgi:hypothetical protein